MLEEFRSFTNCIFVHGLKSILFMELFSVILFTIVLINIIFVSGKLSVIGEVLFADIVSLNLLDDYAIFLM